jgi:hypothetical protein
MHNTNLLTLKYMLFIPINYLSVFKMTTLINELFQIMKLTKQSWLSDRLLPHQIFPYIHSRTWHHQ